jgi:hypothetical protein
VCAGLWLFPLAFGLFRKETLRLAAWLFVPFALAITGIMIYYYRTEQFPGAQTWPMFQDSFWTLREIGRTEMAVPGDTIPPAPAFGAWAGSILGAALCSVLLAGMIRRPSRDRAEPFLAWLIAGHLFLIALVWLIFDRYILVIAPPMIALALCGRTIQRPALAGMLVGLLATVSMTGVRDHLAYNAATWQGIEELRRIGARDTEINGGYVVNGWLQSTHPDSAPRNVRGRILAPWYVPEEEAAFRYEVSNSPQPGRRVLKTIPYTRWLGRSGSIYLLEQSPAP